MSTATDIEIPFAHQQAAHCESGAIGSLLRHHGLEISEPMAFGIGGGITFAYLPFVNFGGQPLFAYRMPPGHIIATLTRRLGVRMRVRTFRSRAAGTAALDACLAAGQPVGLQTSAYWLSYFPPDMRFHFNAHNLVVHGRRAGGYLISDPVIDIRVSCPAEDLARARFTRGVMAPRGRLYYPRAMPVRADFPRAIRRAIRRSAGMMLYTPAPVIGVRGIRAVARRIKRLADGDAHAARLLLGHIVRMQEEIGTGGAGFRFLYAAFLQESAARLELPELDRIAADLADVGDGWRAFALAAAKMCKGRRALDPVTLAGQLRELAAGEAGIWRRLRAAVQ